MTTHESFAPDPILDEIRKEYDLLSSEGDDILAGMRTEIANRLRQIDMCPVIKIRVKSFESYYFKRLKNKNGIENEKPVTAISDVLGLRIICPFIEGLQKIESCIRESFTVIEIERKGEDHSYNQFGYNSIHLLVMVPGMIVGPYGREAPAVCEIQLRTILQDAWAEVEHELVYKAELTPFDEPLKRKLAALNANLTLSDLIFQEVRDYQRRLYAEIVRRREGISEQFMEFSDRHMGMERARSETETDRSDTMDDLLVRALSAHNAGEFVSAISLYTLILDMTNDEQVQAIVLLHRGMAFLAEGEYDKALADFAESIRLKPENVQAFYYRGITHQNLGDYEAAGKDLTTAVQLNPFRFDLLFKSAQIYYHLGDIGRALDVCDKALKIEPDSAPAQQLYRLLKSGFDG
jgi:putative GTP pyrophosphokinase